MYISNQQSRKTVVGTSAGPSGIPRNLALPNSRREFPGILKKLRSVMFFPVISLFVQFHYHLQQTLGVNYNVLSIKLPTVKVKKKKNRPTCIRREN